MVLLSIGIWFFFCRYVPTHKTVNIYFLSETFPEFFFFNYSLPVSLCEMAPMWDSVWWDAWLPRRSLNNKWAATWKQQYFKPVSAYIHWWMFSLASVVYKLIKKIKQINSATSFYNGIFTDTDTIFRNITLVGVWDTRSPNQF